MKNQKFNTFLLREKRIIFENNSPESYHETESLEPQNRLEDLKQEIGNPELNQELFEKLTQEDFLRSKIDDIDGIQEIIRPKNLEDNNKIVNLSNTIGPIAISEHFNLKTEEDKKGKAIFFVEKNVYGETIMHIFIPENGAIKHENL